MKQEIKERWVEAIRSGKYEQGKGSLSSNGKFCCLAVLCEIVKDEINLKTEIDGTYTLYGIGRKQGPLPFEVVDYAGLDSCLPSIKTKYENEFDGVPFLHEVEISLATLNDCGVPFDKIADLIEGRL